MEIENHFLARATSVMPRECFPHIFQQQHYWSLANFHKTIGSCLNFPHGCRLFTLVLPSTLYVTCSERSKACAEHCNPSAHETGALLTIPTFCYRIYVHLFWSPFMVWLPNTSLRRITSHTVELEAPLICLSGTTLCVLCRCLYCFCSSRPFFLLIFILPSEFVLYINQLDIDVCSNPARLQVAYCGEVWREPGRMFLCRTLHPGLPVRPLHLLQPPQEQVWRDLQVGEMRL